MNRKYLMMAAVAAALAGPMAAHAQQSDQAAPAPQAAPMPDTNAAPAPQQAAPMPGTDTNANMPTAAPSATQAAMPVSATTDATGSQVVSNGPVPDTRANRAKYGRPMSRAGKMTKPAGN